jgi:hypothetical protein
MEWIAYIIIFVVALILAVVLAPKPPAAKAALLEDFDMPTAEPGRPIPVVFGTYVVKAPNVVWYGDLRSEAVMSD